MTRAEEWDWPPTRHRKYYRPRRRKYYDVYQPGSWDPVDIYQPSGWNSPVTKRVVDVYWRVTVACIKMLLITALTILAFGASWLFMTCVMLYFRVKS
jgi:hypothetical protein